MIIEYSKHTQHTKHEKFLSEKQPTIPIMKKNLLFYLLLISIPNISKAQQDTLFFKDNATGEVIPAIKQVYNGNYPMKLDGADIVGECHYEYIMLPNEESRVYHGTFQFSTNRAKKVGKDVPYSLSGIFILDVKEGEWYEEFIGYGDDNGLTFSGKEGKHITRYHMRNGLLNGSFEYEFRTLEGNFRVLHIQCRLKDNRLVDSMQVTRFYSDGNQTLYAYFNEQGKADKLWKDKVIRNDGTSYAVNEWQYNNGKLERIKSTNHQTGKVTTANIGTYASSSDIELPLISVFGIKDFEEVLSMGWRFRKGQLFGITHPFKISD